MDTRVWRCIFSILQSTPSEPTDTRVWWCILSTMHSEPTSLLECIGSLQVLQLSGTFWAYSQVCLLSLRIFSCNGRCIHDYFNQQFLLSLRILESNGAFSIDKHSSLTVHSKPTNQLEYFGSLRHVMHSEPTNTRVDVFGAYKYCRVTVPSEHTTASTSEYTNTPVSSDDACGLLTTAVQ
jgi:hypothetical protein